MTATGEPRATGRCLCGAVTFDVHGELRDVYHCHCHRCRRFTGHYLATTSTDASAVDVADGSSCLRWYDTGAGAAYGFCARCGSSLFWRSADDTRLSICAGTLDPPTHLTSAEAWWTIEASDYHVRPALPEYETE